MSTAEKLHRVQVWDPLVRLCHWGIVGLLPLCWYSADIGAMEWHQSCAYVLATLLLVRLCWGVWGSEPARFGHFVRSPCTVWNYVRGRMPAPAYGHNPLGAYMVLLLWLLLLAQFVSGLCISDDIWTDGPLYGVVPSAVSRWMGRYHHQAFWLLAGAVVVHVCALLIYRWRGIALLPAMIHGQVAQEAALPSPVLGSWRLGIGLLLGFGALAAYFIVPLW